MGVRRIVKLSAFGADVSSPVALMRDHAETEDEIKASGLAWTFIRPHLYMQNLLRFGEKVAEHDTFSAPMAHDAYSLVDTRDIAEVAARILTTDGHESQVYTLTSPYASTCLCSNFKMVWNSFHCLMVKTICFHFCLT